MRRNSVKLAGLVKGIPVMINLGGMTYAYIELITKRASGREDIVPVIFNPTLLELVDPDTILEVTIGEYRSYNEVDIYGKKKLVLVVYAKKFKELNSAEHKEDINIINMSGHICKKPVFRTTPMGRDICEMLIAVSTANGYSAYIPTISWGSIAKYSGDLNVGDEVFVVGRVQSREYEKVFADGTKRNKIAWEVSANKLDCLPNNKEGADE